MTAPYIYHSALSPHVCKKCVTFRAAEDIFYKPRTDCPRCHVIARRNTRPRFTRDGLPGTADQTELSPDRSSSLSRDRSAHIARSRCHVIAFPVPLALAVT